MSRHEDRYRDRSRSPDRKRKREDDDDRRDSSRRSPKRPRILDGDDEGFYFDDTEDGWAKRERTAADEVREKRHRERLEALRDEEMPKVGSIHRGKVMSIKDFGVFVEIAGYKRQGLVHITQISNFKIEDIRGVVSQGDEVWVKVTNIDAELGKYSLSMKYVSQTDGLDLDPNNIKMTLDNDRRKSGGKFFDHQKIELEAVVNATCTKCGGKGHVAVECWNLGGKQYELIEDETGGNDITKRKKIADAVGSATIPNNKPAPHHEHHHHQHHGHHHHDHKDKNDKKDKDKKHKEKEKDKKHKHKDKKQKDKDKKHKKHKH